MRTTSMSVGVCQKYWVEKPVPSNSTMRTTSMSVKVCQKYWVEKPVPTIKSVAIDLNHEFTEPLLKNKQEIQSYIVMLDDLLEKKYRFQKVHFFQDCNHSNATGILLFQRYSLNTLYSQIAFQNRVRVVLFVWTLLMKKHANSGNWQERPLWLKW